MLRNQGFANEILQRDLLELPLQRLVYWPDRWRVRRPATRFEREVQLPISKASIDLAVQRAVQGDGVALAQVFQSVRSRLRQAIAMRMDPRLGGRIDPSDVVQETYLDAVRRFDEFTTQPERMPLLLWLRLLAMQRLVDLHRQHLRAQMRDASLEVSIDRVPSPQASNVWVAKELVDHHGTGSSVAMRTELRQSVQAALDSMDSTDREVLVMRHFEVLTNQEVALVLGISEKASSNRYVRALRRLKELFVDDNEVRT